jgi:hypothetical protein
MVGGLDLNIIVTYGNQVGDGVLFKYLFGFKECADLPFLIVLGKKFFELCPRTNYSNVGFKFGIDPRQETSPAHLDPALCRIGNYESHLGS